MGMVGTVGTEKVEVLAGAWNQDALRWALPLPPCFLGLVLALAPHGARSFIRAPWANGVLALPYEPAP